MFSRVLLASAAALALLSHTINGQSFTNPSFESCTNGLPTGWTQDGAQNVQCSAVRSHTGQNSALFSLQSFDSSSISQALNVIEAGQQITVSFWLYLENPPENTDPANMKMFAVEVTFNNPDGTSSTQTIQPQLVQGSNTKANNMFYQYTATFTAPNQAGQTGRVNIKFESVAPSCTIYLDDALITLAAISSSSTGPAALSSSAFSSSRFSSSAVSSSARSSSAVSSSAGSSSAVSSSALSSSARSSSAVSSSAQSSSAVSSSARSSSALSSSARSSSAASSSAVAASSSRVASSSSTGGAVSSSILAVSSSTSSAAVVGDPSFVGLRGQSYQVHGIDGEIYNLITSETTQINSRFVFLTQGKCPIFNGIPDVNCWSHPGSYLGEIGIQQRVGDHINQLLLVSGPASKGFLSVSLNGKAMNINDTFVDADLFSVTYVSSHQITCSTEEFDFTFDNSDLFINQAVGVRKPMDELTAHGMFGQTHKKTIYHTAIKYIEGSVDDYLVNDQNIWSNDFFYNQFKN